MLEYVKYLGTIGEINGTEKNKKETRTLTLHMPHGTIKFYIIIHSHSELLNPNDLEYMCTTIVQSIFSVLL